MTRLRKLILLVAAAVTLVAEGPLSVGAYTLAETFIPTSQPSVPLIITAYRINENGIDLEFFELFNQSNSIINLTQFSIWDVENSRAARLKGPDAGYMRPDTHVVVSVSGYINDSTYSLDSWTGSEETPIGLKPIKTISIRREGYNQTTTTLGDYGVVRVRNLIASGYSSATSVQAYGDGSWRPKDSEGRVVLYDDGVYVVPEAPRGLLINEVYSYASSCSPLESSVLCGDFIELYNDSLEAIVLDDLVLRTDSNSSGRTSSNTFTLAGELLPYDFLLISLTDSGGRLSLTNSGGYVWVEDAWGLRSYSETLQPYPSASSSQQGYAYAIDDELYWHWTTTPTPGQANVITTPVSIVAACPEGKYRNPETGRCRNIEDAVNELAACAEGYERNPLTNRCRKISSTSTLTPCLEGYERNPATNRCRSIAGVVAGLMPCDEGYERNPSTNRCRKVVTSEVPAAPFAVEPYEQPVQAWQWWVGGTIAAGVAGYAIWEWRKEISQFLLKFKRK